MVDQGEFLRGNRLGSASEQEWLLDLQEREDLVSKILDKVRSYKS